MKKFKQALFVFVLLSGLISLSGCAKTEDEDSSSQSGFFPRLGI